MGSHASESRGCAGCLRPSTAGPPPAQSWGPGSQTLADQQVSTTWGRKGQESVLGSHRVLDQVREPQRRHIKPEWRGTWDRTQAKASSGTLYISGKCLFSNTFHTQVQLLTLPPGEPHTCAGKWGRIRPFGFFRSEKLAMNTFWLLLFS